MSVSISVIIPTFNRAHVLRRALESVYNQTRSADEIIVVDDGSTDRTLELLKEYDVKVITQENRGVSAARNSGIKAAKGNWVALLDSDDEWLPEKLESQLESLAKFPKLEIFHTEEIWIRNGIRVNQKLKHQKKGGRIFMDCLPFCRMGPSSILLKKSLFQEIGYFREDFPVCEDYDLWLKLTAQKEVFYDSEPRVIKYGGHEDQLSRSMPGMDEYRIKSMMDLRNMAMLSPEESQALDNTLSDKLTVYIKGLKKHRHFEKAQFYEDQFRALSPNP